ncbi:MAG: peptidoglycan DD-metalloendopeptidase family protein [Anaerolineae bacterium]
MIEKRNRVQRLSGHLILLVIALALFLGWRTGLADGRSEAEGPSSAAAPLVEDTNTAVVQSQENTGKGSTDLVQLPEASFTDMPLVSDTSLVPASIPHTFHGRLPEHRFDTYVVKRGDTPNSIAEKFGIKPETLLGGNPRISQESSLLQTGIELVILPIDGVLHDVQPGDTIEHLVDLYSVPLEDIAAYEPNNLEFPYRLYPGTQIMVPGAVRELFVWTPPDLTSVSGKGSTIGGSVAPVIVGTGTFIFPIRSRVFTQYYWYGHPGIDVAVPEGSAIYAADTGTVTYASWNTYGYGNLVVINHGNGYETFYAHLSGFNVVPGQIVYQGSLIAASGDTGNSSGPHIHFEIRYNNNRENPCWYLGC